MSHNHCHCNHELKHCEICDVVYCTKCSKEWKQDWAYTWTYPSCYVTGTTSGGTLTLASGGTLTLDGNNTANCSHT